MRDTDVVPRERTNTWVWILMVLPIVVALLPSGSAARAAVSATL